MIDASRGQLGIDGSHDVLKPGERRSVRVRPFLLALLLALGVAGVAASPAWAAAKARSTIKCTSSTELAVTWTFSEFPATGENNIKEEVKLDGAFVYQGVFKFTGPSATNTVTIHISPGHHEITVFAHWNGNGIKGQSDHKFLNGIECSKVAPAFTIEKQQRMKGEASYTQATLTGAVGQTVEYKIIVKDTGSTSLKFSKLSDANCEGISPGGEVELAPGGEQAYTCSHVLNKADQEAGKHENNATITGTPPPGQGEPITHTSNTVVVNVPTPPTCPQAKIGSNFNGTAVAKGDWIWFNSVLKPEGTTSGGTIKFTNQKITIVTKTGTTTLSVPNSTITFSTLATEGSTTFSGGEWVTTVPAIFTDNVFLAGLAYQLPAELEGGANPVTWEGDFTTSSGVSLKWQWGAAVYTTFSSEYNSLEVKPLHSTTLDKYHNGNQAGTPEAFKAFVIGGARGGGGSNFTGSYSGTGSCQAPAPAGNPASSVQQEPVW